MVAATHAPPPAPVHGDLAEHRERAEPGPPPLLRAMIGIGLGMVTGAVAALLTPRQGEVALRRAGRTAAGVNRVRR